MSRELKKIGLEVEEKEDGMILKKSEDIHSAELNSENDHRLFMAFSIVGMFVGDCTVSDPDAVRVSYPKFISDMKNVGADFKYCYVPILISLVQIDLIVSIADKIASLLVRGLLESGTFSILVVI